MKKSGSAVAVDGLRKSYGALEVLKGIDLRVPRGSVFSLLGPNGAGKTTLVRVLATLTPADGGQVAVAGYDVREQRSQVRRRIALTGQFAAVDAMLTGAETLRMTARLAGHSRAGARRRAAELLERFDLVHAADRRASTYSGGMRRRLDLAACLVGEPEVVFLDEPTTGLDPRSRQALWEIVAALAASGVTVFLTTQYLEEADQLANRVAVVDGGSIVAEGSPTELKTAVGEQRLDLTARDEGSYALLTAYLHDRAVHRDAERRVVGLATDGSAAQVRALLDEVDPARTEIVSFAVRSATLDDVFLALTGSRAGATPQEPARV